MRKLLSVVLSLMMLFTMTVPAMAAMQNDVLSPETTNYQQVSKLSEGKSALYRVEFKNGIKINSTENLKNLEMVSAGVEQVVFSIDAGEDTFTIGYYLGEQQYNWNKILEEIQKAVNDLNFDILNEDRLAGNSPIQFENLEVLYFEIQTERIADNLTKSSTEVELTPSVVINQLSGVKEYYSISAAFGDLSNMVNCTSDNNLINTRSNYAVDGSYHYLVSNLGDVYTYYYNQITGETRICLPTLTSPHGGDGNMRYVSGYRWFPDEVIVHFWTYSQENRTQLWYEYSADTLAHLNVDSNEALEMEVVFYNYTNATNVSDRGNAFQLVKSGATWTTNQPNSYLDTNFADNANEVSFCVGVDDTSDLEANKTYYWSIYGNKGNTTDNYNHDGRFKVVAQRSYRCLGSGTWFVFAEEHETVRWLGFSSGNWLPADLSAWVLANNASSWSFDADSDPVQ